MSEYGHRKRVDPAGAIEPAGSIEGRQGGTPGAESRSVAEAARAIQQGTSAWQAPTGTASRATFDTASVTTAQLAQRVKALIDDLLANNLLSK